MKKQKNSAGISLPAKPSLGIFALAFASLAATAHAVRVPARSTDSFVDSVGVNIHIQYTGTAYDKYDDVGSVKGWKSYLLESNIRHVRDGLYLSPSRLARYNELAANGIGFTVVAFRGQLATGADAVTAANNYGTDVIEAIEGENEIQNIYVYGTPDPIQEITAANALAAQTYHKALFNAMKADATWKHYPLIAPSFVGRNAAVSIGSLAAWSDYGNAHSYPAPRNARPTYGISDEMGSAEYIVGARAMVATETGFHSAVYDSNGKQPMTPESHGKYIPRVLFAGFNANLGRSFLYEFVDEFTNSTNGVEDNDDEESHYGLLDRVLSPSDVLAPKPGYTAIKNLLGRIKEGTWNGTQWVLPGFTPSYLDFDLLNATKNIHYTLLQKSTGKYYLALWQDARSVNNGTPGVYPTNDTVAAVNVTLRVNTPMNSSFAIYNPLTNTSTTGTLSGTPQQATIAVYDEVRLIELTPSSGVLEQKAAFWNFDDYSDVTMATDMSGSGKHLTFNGPYGSVYKTGNMNGSFSGYAARFNGTDGYASVASSVVNTNNSYSVSAWVRVEAIGNRQAVSQVGNNSHAYALGTLDTGAFRFRINIADNTTTAFADAVSSTVAQIGQWYHLTGVYDKTAAKARIYVNGALAQEVNATGSFFNAAGGTRVGGSKWNGASAGFWNGMVDDVKVYPKVLSATEVLAISSGKLGRGGWIASASNGNASAVSAIDNSQLTAWSTATPMTNGMWYQIDRGAGTLPGVNRILMDSGEQKDNSPRTFEILAGATTTSLTVVKAADTGTSNLVNVILDSPNTSRFIRIRQTGSSPDNYWSMTDLQMFGTR